MQTWLKENLFMVAAIALPVVVAAMFALATAIPRLSVEDPRYELLLVIDLPLQHGEPVDIRYAVENRVLTANAGYRRDHDTYRARHLYRYDGAVNRLHKIDVSVPESVRQALAERADGDRRVTERIALPADLSGLTLLTDTTAPDGYTFRNRRAGGAGIFGELFGTGRRHHGIVLERGGRIVELPVADIDAYPYYHDVQFLGWIAQ